MTDFGPKLRSAREELGLSQSQFAAVMGMARTNLNRLENGHQTPTLQTYQAITSYLRGWGVWDE